MRKRFQSLLVISFLMIFLGGVFWSGHSVTAESSCPCDCPAEPAKPSSHGGCKNIVEPYEISGYGYEKRSDGFYEGLYVTQPAGSVKFKSFTKGYFARCDRQTAKVSLSTQIKPEFKKPIIIIDAPETEKFWKACIECTIPANGRELFETEFPIKNLTFHRYNEEITSRDLQTYGKTYIKLLDYIRWVYLPVEVGCDDKRSSLRLTLNAPYTLSNIKVKAKKINSEGTEIERDENNKEKTIYLDIVYAYQGGDGFDVSISLDKIPSEDRDAFYQVIIGYTINILEDSGGGMYYVYIP